MGNWTATKHSTVRSRIEKMVLSFTVVDMVRTIKQEKESRARTVIRIMCSIINKASSMSKSRVHKRIHYPPGSLIYNGPHRDEAVRVRIVHFNEEVFDEHEYTGDQKMFDRPGGTTTWIHVNGIHQTEHGLTEPL